MAKESDSNKVIVDDVLDGDKQIPAGINCETLEHALLYLGHHKGVEPDPLPVPVRSIHMSQICSDKWDADWIDAFDKKTIFEVILAGNYLDIKCLVHLGCAKIATLIKQLDQQEINRIIEEEERYRREQAQQQAIQSGQQDSVFGLTGNNDNNDNDDNDDTNDNNDNNENNDDNHDDNDNNEELLGLDQDENDNI
eukprot:CAMPEP_0201593494 /NCGR_PEP_ID=MMETSP0190_2-20130828/191078_1 /ASSEMBLY_ACC=CAM_ASM_000263 /TAXON_ID=37353 /ORGANISM="Rosalina sp." /LENGTH=194 /DNA_ID=CAMNT_0048052701 /DNA_START=742 /DNA_END=1326 /DNA_ORIENTATION=+